MNALEKLLSNRWIVKEENKELYYQVRDELGPVRKFITEKLGYQLIVNPYLVRLEKIPAKAEAWMGIEGFTDKLEYAFLCVVLMFLEDKDVGEQFILSQLTEYIQSTYKYEEVDWTKYSTRRHLVRVMHFCMENHMIRVNDGNEESFAYENAGDVLYENTGISRYFMKNFAQSVENYNTIDDFSNSEWIGMDEDRGVVRRQRVYRGLLMNMGIYKTEETEEDFIYIRQYRRMIQDDLEGMIDGELQIYRTSAYFVLDEQCRLGRRFPGESNLHDIVLLCNGLLLERMEKGSVEVRADESIQMDYVELQNMIQDCKERYGRGFTKKYREMTTGAFVKEVEEYLVLLEWVTVDADFNVVHIKPIMGKVTGCYPKDFAEGAEHEQ